MIPVQVISYSQWWSDQIHCTILVHADNATLLWQTFIKVVYNQTYHVQETLKSKPIAWTSQSLN